MDELQYIADRIYARMAEDMGEVAADHAIYFMAGVLVGAIAAGLALL